MIDLLVNEDNYKILNLYDPIGYTSKMNNQIILLIHKKDEVLFMNIGRSNNMDLDSLYDEIFDLESVNKIEVFTTMNDECLNVLKYIFNKCNIKYIIYNIFTDKYGSSIGYNYLNNEYYSIYYEGVTPVLRKRQKRLLK